MDRKILPESTFLPKSHFFAKSHFWTSTSQKCEKWLLSEKVTFLLPGTERNIKKLVATGTSESLGAESHFRGPEIAKSDFWAHFRSRSHFFIRFRKFRIFRTRARHGRKPYIILVNFNGSGGSKSRKSAFEAKK